MTITKYEHACLDIHLGSSRLLVDPGVFTTSLSDFREVTAVVITHSHSDHFDPEKIADILAASPSVQIYTTTDVAQALGDGVTTVPNIGQTYTAGDFSLEFFGGEHEGILPGMPVPQNFGVLVNDALYYPGDSFAPCPKPHSVLAAPSVAPWLKLSEAAAFISSDQLAQKVFFTHNALLSDIGLNITNNILGKAVTDSGKEFVILNPGESLEA